MSSRALSIVLPLSVVIAGELIISDAVTFGVMTFFSAWRTSSSASMSVMAFSVAEAAWRCPPPPSSLAKAPALSEPALLRITR